MVNFLLNVHALYMCVILGCHRPMLCKFASVHLKPGHVALYRTSGQKMVHGRTNPTAARLLLAELCRSARRRRRRL